MSLCELTGGAKRLQKATKLLKEQWARTREHWQDQTAAKFEEDHLQPLGERIKLALAAVGRLAEVFDEAEKQLSDQQ
ncbi:MAG: hypothetical protein KDA41_10695 [Planctomycetales bacterium]|nr:hypothetical protein [Planctomycetales bacterium]